MVEGGEEGEEGGDRVPFYLHRAQRLVTFTGEKGKKEADKENKTARKDIRR